LEYLAMTQQRFHPKLVLAAKLAAACSLCLGAILLVIWLTGY
jgi:hypothetical protein